MSALFAALLLFLDAHGYGLREVRYDVKAGAVEYVPSGKKAKTRVVVPEKQAAPIQKALAAARLDAPPASEPRNPNAPFMGMRKLSENFYVTLTFDDGKTASYAYDARFDESDAPKRLQPIVEAIGDAVDYLDTPPIQTVTGRLEIGVQDGKVGVAVDKWSLYRPFADDPRVEKLRAYKGKRVKLTVAADRDRPDVYILEKVLEPLQ